MTAVTIFNVMLICGNSFIGGFNYAAWKDRGIIENKYGAIISAVCAGLIFLIEVL